MDRKGQITLNKLYPAILALLIVGIVIGLGIYILDQTGEAMSTTTYTVVNTSTAAAVTESGAAVDLAADCGFHDMTVLEIYAGNGSPIIAAANYTTVNADGGIIYYTGSGGWENDTVWNVSYTYVGTKDVGVTSPCGSSALAGTGIGTFANWIAVIVVVLAAAIVLGIVMRSFGSNTSI